MGDSVKLLDRPVRISMIIGIARKFPEKEAADISLDELKGTLLEMGVSIPKVATMEDISLEGIRTVKNMTDQEAFTYFADRFTYVLRKMGVDQSVIRGLRFE
jgi:hypothetical protein